MSWFTLSGMGKFSLALHRRQRHFHAHETARFDALSGLPLACFRQRAWAIAIDMLIILALQTILGMRGCHRAETESGPVTLASLIMKVAEEVEHILEFTLYFAVMLKLGNGQTPGKKWMKVRVVSLTHDSLGWWQSIERGLGYGASMLELGFGFLQFFINRNQQCVHDRIAETIVIDVRPTAKRLGDETIEPDLV
jgi:uncharacterized RDD family membrane protein YckC